MPLRYKSRWTERDTAEFTRHHVSGKDTAVLMPSVRRLSILPSPAHAQMIIGHELRSEVERWRVGDTNQFDFRSMDGQR